MLNIITSQTSFISLLLLFVTGMVGSLLFRKNDSFANTWNSFFAISGSLWGLLFTVSRMLVGNDNLSFSTGISNLPFTSISFHIDKLSSFFIFVISLIALFCSIYGIGYIKHFYKKYNIGELGFFYNLFILCMILVVSASNGIFFLIVWEIMSISSYFLVIYDHKNESNVKAGFLYLIMTHIGTAFITLSFLLMYKYTNSFDFTFIKLNINLIPSLAKDTIFILALIGFGIKAGIIPFHIWLPSAHPAAPSHVSALMSGVMIKTAIYMMIRIFLDILYPIPTWWGLTLLIIGATSSLLGVLYALTEHDIKRLLAYSSIENIGIILLGLGSALTFSSLNMPPLTILALAATLFHTLNHSIFKSLLFLSAGSVINETHTRNMEKYGGLIKYMPQTAFFFLIGSMAISALPPFNGFFSEWLIFQSLFQGIASSDFSVKLIFILSIGSLAFTGGLALTCFVKAFGITFLARPRSLEVNHAQESSFSLQLGMGSLAALSILFGIFSGYIISILEKIGHNLSSFQNADSFISISMNQGIVIGNDFSYLSSPIFIILFIVSTFIVIFTIQFLINKNQKVKIGNTWDCGTDLTPRMEITATGFSRSIILIFKEILKPQKKYLHKSKSIVLSTQDVYYSYFYEPLKEIIYFISSFMKKIQNGNIHTYILYIFIALIIALFSIL